MLQRTAQRQQTHGVAGVAGLATVAAILASGVSGCYTRVASLHPATDITQGASDGDQVFLPDNGADSWDPRSRDPRAYGNYPEDRYLDPYAVGLTYWDHYGSGSSGYQGYYDTPWWLDPQYHPHSGGGGWSGGSGTPAMDSTGARVQNGRRLWSAPDLRDPPPVPPVVGHEVSGPGSGGTGNPTPPVDSTRIAPKKGTGRRLWR